MTAAVSGSPSIGSLQWEREMLVSAFTDALQRADERAARRVSRMDWWRMGVDATALIMIAALMWLLSTHLLRWY
jgi:hypothetical protein